MFISVGFLYINFFFTNDKLYNYKKLFNIEEIK